MFKYQNIAFVFPSLKPGGGNRAMIQLYDHHIKEGYLAKIFYLKNKGLSLKLKQNYVSHEQKLISDSKYHFVMGIILILMKIKKDKDINIVFFSDPIISIFSILLSNKKLIRYVQADELSLFKNHPKSNFIFNSIYKMFNLISMKYKYHKVLFNSQYSYDVYNSVVKNLSFHYLPPSLFNADYRLDKKHFEKIIYKKKFVVGTIARLHKTKGYSDFIWLSENMKDNRFSFISISQDDLPKNNFIENFKPNSDEEYQTILKKCDILINTSYFEGFGLPPLEAMSFGLFVIAKENQGLKQYATNDNIITYKNKKDLIYILKYSVNDKRSFIKIIKSGKKTSKNFRIKNIHKTFLKLIQ